MEGKSQFFLTGFMASGKSTLGKQLASRLNLTFFDLDEEIVRKAGKSISSIFKSDGEAAFRRLELATLKDLCQNNEAFVMATGGGAMCSEEGLKLMKKGFVIYLKLPVEIILGRLRQNRSSRPLVADIPEEELGDYISGKLNERLPYYRQADLIINAENLKVAQLAESIANQLK